MPDLDHLAREFEKLHDSMPLLLSRMAVIEAWQSGHPETHRLEKVVLDTAKIATDAKLHEMNELRKQIDSERGLYPTRELMDTKLAVVNKDIDDLRSSRDTEVGSKTTEQSFFDRYWPLFVAVIVVVAEHFWK
jgi:hypothetical protein